MVKRKKKAIETPVDPPVARVTSIVTRDSAPAATPKSVEHVTVTPEQFTALQAAYRDDPANVFTALDALSPEERLALLLNNIGEGNRHNTVNEKADNLPAAYQRVKVRWAEYFDYMLRYFDRPALERHMPPHLASEADGGTYIRNALALLVWKSIRETPETNS